MWGSCDLRHSVLFVAERVACEVMMGPGDNQSQTIVDIITITTHHYKHTTLYHSHTASIGNILKDF